MQLSVIVPCLNEALNLDELAGRMSGVFDVLGSACELVLVDDGSRDDTWAVMQRLAARDPRVVALRHARNQGIVEGWRTGVTHARGELVCILDADLQYRPEDIPRLLEARRAAGVEIAQGARRYAWSARGSRYRISRAYNALVNAVFGMTLPDNKSGFLVCRREVFAALLPRGRYHAWQNLVMVAAWAAGHRSVSVPCEFEPRRRGNSFLSDVPVGHAARSLVDLGVGLMEYGRIGVRARQR